MVGEGGEGAEQDNLSMICIAAATSKPSSNHTMPYHIIPYQNISIELAGEGNGNNNAIHGHYTVQLR
eukprot:COSAG06_NODE_5215_length_3632_cov_1.923861_4_plen_67_part_00